MIIDRVLARLIRRALMQDPRLSSQSIEVIVEHGVVRLHGCTRSAAGREAAERLAASFPGVRQVVNALHVETDEALADGDVAELARTALETHPGIMKESIWVAVQDGVLTLYGTVGTDAEAMLAADVALSVRGVHEVRNRLSIDVLDRIDDLVTARQVKTALNQAPELGGHRIRVAVARETVVLSGFVRSPAQREFAMRLAGRLAADQIRDEIRIEAPDGAEPSPAADAVEAWQAPDGDGPSQASDAADESPRG